MAGIVGLGRVRRLLMLVGLVFAALPVGSAVANMTSGSVASSFPSTDQVRQRLIQAHLIGRPLFPIWLPDPLGWDTRASLYFGNCHGPGIPSSCRPSQAREYFQVQYRRAGSLGIPYADFARNTAGFVRENVTFDRQFHHPVWAVKMHRLDRLLSGTGYCDKQYTRYDCFWAQGKFSYLVGGAPNLRFIHQFIYYLAPLGHEWTGGLPGGRIILYAPALSLGIVDYRITWNDPVAQEGYETLTRVSANGSFHTSQHYADSANDAVTFTLGGTLTWNGTAQGAFEASTDDGSGDTASVGSLWRAFPVT